MNTYRIYEDLRLTLGEEAAKSLAHTLGPMFEEARNAVTKTEFRELCAAIEARNAVVDTGFARLADAQSRTEAKVSELAEGQSRLTEAQSRLEGRVSELAEAQSRTETKVSELAEAQSRTEAKISELAEAQSRTEAKVSELAEGQSRLTEAQSRLEGRVSELAVAQSRTEAKVSELAVALGSLTNTVERLSIRTDAVVGRTFELQFRDRLSSYLGRFLRRSKLLRNDEVLDAIESVLDSEECDEVLRVDAIASGLVDGVPSHVVVEVSSTGDTDDVVRAERRAAILRKAGMVAIPVVACEAISRETALFAQARGVRVWCSGTMLGAAG
jgi:predicted nuclease with TOPRIM domain